jgi:hypothetical protein
MLLYHAAVVDMLGLASACVYARIERIERTVGSI